MAMIQVRSQVVSLRQYLSTAAHPLDNTRHSVFYSTRVRLQALYSPNIKGRSQGYYWEVGYK